MGIKIKNLSVILFLLVSCSLARADDCKNAMTQYDMNMCSKAAYDRVDAELNRIYKQALVKAKADPLVVEMIKRSERAWIKYRDAQVEMYYPPRNDSLIYYGSFHPVCINSMYEVLTRKRIDELKAWMKPTEEGDMCAW